MKKLLRIFFVGLAFSTTCLLADSVSTLPAASPQAQQKSEKVAKKTHKKHKKSKKAPTQ